RPAGNFLKKAPAMRLETCKYVLAAIDLEIFAAYFHGDDLLTAQGRRKTAPPHLAVLFDEIILAAHGQKNSGNKTVPIHGALLVNMAYIPICYRMRPMDRASFLRVAH
ncbi:hypothetical protein, partial [Candidatus Electronema sp. JM]|uniref:hypothetical protein n=1 Tax=Candidatus Electronema sp. JM TaxID=3401571 RepID=UPI003AA8D4FF